MSRTMISSSWATSKITDRTPAGSSNPSRSGSSPTAMSSSRTAASAREKSIALRAPAASPSASVRVGVDMTAFGDLDDLGGRVLFLVRVGPGLSRLVDRVRRRPVPVGALRTAVRRRPLGRGHHRRLVGQEAGLAGEPRRAQRALLDGLEERGELLGVQRLVLEQVEDEAVEDGAVVVDDVPGLVVGAVDQAADLLVDDAGDVLAVVALVPHVAAEEDLTRGLAELDGPHPLAHAVLGDHLAGHRGGLLDVVGGTGGGVVEHDLLRDATTERVGQLVEDLVAGRRVLVVGRH